MSRLDFRQERRGKAGCERLSGGRLPRRLTGAQRLALYVEQRRLRAEFYRRQAQQ